MACSTRLPEENIVFDGKTIQSRADTVAQRSTRAIFTTEPKRCRAPIVNSPERGPTLSERTIQHSMCVS